MQATRQRRDILIDEAAYAVIALFASFFVFMRFLGRWTFMACLVFAVGSFAVRVPLKFRGHLRRDYSMRGWIRRGVVVGLAMAAFFTLDAVLNPERRRFPWAALLMTVVATIVVPWVGYRRSLKVEDPAADESRSVRQMAVIFVVVVVLGAIAGATLSSLRR